jgi:hypothetical protein
LRFRQKNSAAKRISAIPTTGITTAIAVLAPVSSPLLPPLLLFEASFANAAAEEDAAAASAELVVDDGAAVVDSALCSEVRVTTTVTALALSAAFVGVWVTTDVITCVVSSAEAAVLVTNTSLDDSLSLVAEAEVSERSAEDTDDAMDDEISCCVEEEGMVVWAELEMLDVVTAAAEVSVENELMAAAAAAWCVMERTY